MKMSLRRLFFLGAALTVSGAACAQEGLEKETVIVDYFSRAREVPPVYMEAVRSNVIAAFVDRGRHQVVDAQAVAGSGAPSQGLISGPAALVDGPSQEEARRKELIEATGARYIVTGAVTDYLFRHESAAGKDRFVTAMRLVLTGADLQTGKEIKPEEFKLTGQGATAEEADARALNGMQYSLLFYIDNRFKFQTQVLRLAPPDAKGRLKELYIRCGTAMGVQRQDLFLVYRDTDMGGGAIAREQVGKLRVKEVLGDEVTKCTVVKGGPEITEAFVAGRPLVVVSDTESLF